MSKRFGRNQKRKMRESFRQAEDKLEDKNKEVLRLKAIHRANAEAVALTEQILGEYFAGLPVKHLEMNDNLPRMQMATATRVASSFDLDQGESAFRLTQKLLTLDTIKMSVYLEKLRGIVRVEGGMPEGPYVAMSIDAMRYLPPYAIEHMLQQNFIPHLVKEIKRHLNGKNV